MSICCTSEFGGRVCLLCFTLHTRAAVAERLLTGTEGGQWRDGQRRRAGNRLEMLAAGRDGRGLRVNAVRTGEILVARRERTLPVGEPDGHLTPEVKPCQRTNTS